MHGNRCTNVRMVSSSFLNIFLSTFPWNAVVEVYRRCNIVTSVTILAKNSGGQWFQKKQHSEPRRRFTAVHLKHLVLGPWKAQVPSQKSYPGLCTAITRRLTFYHSALLSCLMKNVAMSERVGWWKLFDRQWRGFFLMLRKDKIPRFDVRVVEVLKAHAHTDVRKCQLTCVSR